MRLLHCPVGGQEIDFCVVSNLKACGSISLSWLMVLLKVGMLGFVIKIISVKREQREPMLIHLSELSNCSRSCKECRT